MKLLKPEKIINLGEADHPMNGSTFIASPAWGLSRKMSVSNFPPEAVARLDQAPEDSVLWFNAGRHPAQGIIAVSSTTEAGIATGGTHAAAGIATGRDAASNALDSADTSTGSALDKSYRHTLHALGVSARKVGKAFQRSLPAESNQAKPSPQ